MTTPDDVEFLRTIAHHEAGHVLADHLLGVEVSRVLIDPAHGGRTDVDGWDDVDVDGLSSEQRKQRLEPAMISLLAGPFAEERYAGEFDTQMAAADLHEVAALGFERVDRLEEWPAYEAELSARANEMVTDKWHDIELLARELERRRTMDSTDLQAWFEQNPIGGAR